MNYQQQQLLQGMSEEARLELAQRIQAEARERKQKQQEEKQRAKRAQLANRSGEVRTSILIQAELLEDMKLACSHKGTTISQVFRDFCRSYVKKNLNDRVSQQQLNLSE